jgi:FkbM family methyltransferase
MRIVKRGKKFSKTLIFLAKNGNVFPTIYYAIMTLLGKKCKIKFKIGDDFIVIRSSTPDAKVLKSCYSGEFDEVISIIKEPTFGLIIDAGGYIGTAAIVFAKAFPDATIITVEPSSENLNLLIENVSCYRNIHVVERAIVAVDRPSVKLRDRGTGEWGFTVVSEPADNANAAIFQEVATVTIPGLLDAFGKRGADIVKIDIEGGEYDVFSENVDWIKEVAVLVVELHDRIRPGCTEMFLQATEGRQNFETSGEKLISINCASM